LTDEQKKCPIVEKKMRMVTFYALFGSQKKGREKIRRAPTHVTYMDGINGFHIIIYITSHFLII